jgi:hypothetical protein
MLKRIIDAFARAAARGQHPMSPNPPPNDLPNMPKVTFVSPEYAHTIRHGSFIEALARKEAKRKALNQPQDTGLSK